MSNIDRADWHYGGNYPRDLPPENGGTHIGMYLAWIIHRGLGSDELVEMGGDTYQLVLERVVTGRDLLFNELDEKFFDRLLNEEGRQFTAAYYETNDYVNDYDRVLGGNFASLYEVENSWANYDRIARVIDERFAEWRVMR
ncbi:MAG TPA: hypothetical protein VFK26_10475 [Gemmatimonadaceae bacterium]|jgi:hypothetical protein|nr:hypothetical protein [Gemmatimonadaceae bacterium]